MNHSYINGVKKNVKIYHENNIDNIYMNMKGGGLVSEGGYGCIYHPSLTITGTESDHSNFVSKLQVKNFASSNETKIGQQIKKIFNYINYFAPIISSQAIKIGTFDKKTKSVCSAYQRNPKEKFVLSKLHYLEGYVLNNYIIKNINNRKLFMYLLDCFKHILNGISKLNNEGIIHFDLKGENIMFNDKLNIPIIIDFGLSIPLKSIGKNIKNYFYVYAPSYYYWPIEVHFLNYIIHVNKSPKTADIEKISKEYIHGHSILHSNFSKDFITKYEKLCFQALEKLLPLPYDKKVQKVLEMALTWDNYSLSVIYLKYMYYFNVKGFVQNSFITFFTKLLTQNIHPNYLKRYSIEKTINSYDSFWYNEAIHKASNFVEILANLEKTALQMRNVVLKDIKKERKMKRLITLS